MNESNEDQGTVKHLRVQAEHLLLDADRSLERAKEHNEQAEKARESAKWCRDRALDLNRAATLLEAHLGLPVNQH